MPGGSLLLKAILPVAFATAGVIAFVTTPDRGPTDKVWIDLPHDGVTLDAGLMTVVAHVEAIDDVGGAVLEINGTEAGRDDDIEINNGVGLIEIDWQATSGTFRIVVAVDGVGRSQPNDVVITGSFEPTTTTPPGPTTTTGETTTTVAGASTTTTPKSSTTQRSTTTVAVSTTLAKPTVATPTATPNVIDNVPGCTNPTATQLRTTANGANSVVFRLSLNGEVRDVTATRSGDAWTANADASLFGGATGNVTVRAFATNARGTTGSTGGSFTIANCKP